MTKKSKTSKSQETTAPKEIEVENVRLSTEAKDRLLAHLLRQKFDKRMAEIDTKITKQLDAEHDHQFPELRKLTDEAKKIWLDSSSLFEFNSKTNRKIDEFRFSANRQFCKPKMQQTHRYTGRIYIIDPSEKMVLLLEQKIDLEKEKETLADSLKSLFNAVNTSRQLCQLLPELAVLYPKKIKGSDGGQGTALVPVAMIRSIRESISGLTVTVR